MISLILFYVKKNILEIDTNKNKGGLFFTPGKSLHC